jgi:hypothetical protein
MNHTDFLLLIKFAPIEWESWDIPPVVKKPRREADHLLPSNAEVKNDGGIRSLPPHVCMAWCLIN